MSKCLITGCGGFIGSYLAELLLDKGHTVCGLTHQNRENINHLKDRINIINCDILAEDRLKSIVPEIKPDFVFHLAAQSLVMPAWRNPELTFKINILGTLYLLEAIRNAAIDPLVEVAGSSAEYGFSPEDEIPIKETKEFRPVSPYGVSKVAEDMLAYLYWRTHGMKIIRVRPFFVIGPRKVADVCSDFARGIAEIEAGQRDSLSVGNLDTVRDFVDVRDAVRAMWLLAERGKPGEVYNICSGKGYQIKDILARLVSLSSRPIRIYYDPSRRRPSDEPVIIGDNFKLRALGWSPEIPIEKTLADIMDHWRSRTTMTK